MKVLRLIKPIANKEHKCMFCGGIIKKGEQYERQTNINDGSIYDWVIVLINIKRGNHERYK